MDCTVGLGGHSAALLESFPDIRLVAIDRDSRALELAAERLAPFGQRVRYLEASFSELEHRLADLHIDGIRAVLADLGVSSMQLDTAERGFSFLRDGPLDMRMSGGRPPDLLEVADTDSPSIRSSTDSSTTNTTRHDDSEPLDATDIVNGYPEEKLVDIFRKYGEEKQARRIARGIVAARREEAIETTGQLARLVERLKPQYGRPRAGRRRLHPATQVFQALRIEVNRELDELHDLLDQAVRLLEKDGHLAIISYHSLEDRIVKHTLRDLATGEIEPITGRPRAETQVIEVLTKKPVRPDEREIAVNPRARSARLRAARRL